jgi:prepilin-type N-terminal cleavage/methylation domain-containing protein
MKFLGTNSKESGGLRPSPGFTLIELLAVVVVLAILASLTAGSMLSAKRKTRQVQCLSNVRQQSLVLQTFLGDHNEYPLSQSVHVREQYPEHHRFWEGALFPEYLDERDVFCHGMPKVLDCPSAQRPNEFPPNIEYADYGPNAWGLGGFIAKPLLGIGGQGPGPILVDGILVSHYPPPVRISNVRNPAELLALGDGFDGWNDVIKDGNLGVGPWKGCPGILWEQPPVAEAS